MKIIEQGKKIDLSIRFICDVCGCVFEAERNEYEYNQREDEFISTCPNCHCGTSHTKNDSFDDACSKMRVRDIYQS